MPESFPALENITATKETLHLYTSAIGMLPRIYAEAHPRWWHIALEVTALGLASRPFGLPSGRPLSMLLDLKDHQLKVIAEGREAAAFDLTAGWSGSQMGEKLIEAAADLGLKEEVPSMRFASDAPGGYDPEAAARMHQALRLACEIFAQHAAGLQGEVGRVNFWPHNFDMSVEYYGTRQVPREKKGATVYEPAQLNLGLSFGDETHPAPYFYSNPYPFEADRLCDRALPEGAAWVRNRWEGSLFPYANVVGMEDGGDRLLAYARAVYQIARPTLTA